MLFSPDRGKWFYPSPGLLWAGPVFSHSLKQMEIELDRGRLGHVKPQKRLMSFAVGWMDGWMEVVYGFVFGRRTESNVVFLFPPSITQLREPK